MPPSEARRQIATGHLNVIGYSVLKYGHLAIVVRDPEKPERLCLFSSESFKGPNTAEDVSTLAQHDWDAYRLDRWDRVDQRRIQEFVRLARKKAGNWFGYDFTGMFGIWNANLTPSRPEEIGDEYICSTVVVACLWYAGVHLDAVRSRAADLCSPNQVVCSKGAIGAPPDAELVVERVRGRERDQTGGGAGAPAPPGYASLSMDQPHASDRPAPAAAPRALAATVVPEASAPAPLARSSVSAPTTLVAPASRPAGWARCGRRSTGARPPRRVKVMLRDGAAGGRRALPARGAARGEAAPPEHRRRCTTSATTAAALAGDGPSRGATLADAAARAAATWRERGAAWSSASRARCSTRTSRASSTATSSPPTC